MNEKITLKITNEIPKINFILYDNLRGVNNRDYFVVFYIKDTFKKNIELIYKKMRDIVIIMEDFNFIFDKKYQVIINTNSILDEKIKKYSVANVSYQEISLDDLETVDIKKEYDFFYHLTISSGNNQHYLPKNLQKEFFIKYSSSKKENIYVCKSPFKKEELKEINSKLFKKTGCLDNFFSEKEYPLLDIKISRDYELNEMHTKKLIYPLLEKNYSSHNNINCQEILKNIVLPLYFRSFSHHSAIEKSFENEIDVFFKENSHIKNILKNDIKDFINKNKKNILKLNFEKTILINMQWFLNKLNKLKNYKTITIYQNKSNKKSLYLTENVVFFMDKNGEITPFMNQETDKIIYLFNSSTLIFFSNTILIKKDMKNIFKEIKEISLKFSKNFICCINSILEKKEEKEKIGKNYIYENVFSEQEKESIKKDIQHLVKHFKIRRTYENAGISINNSYPILSNNGLIFSFIYESNLERLCLEINAKKKENKRSYSEYSNMNLKKVTLKCEIEAGENTFKNININKKLTINKEKENILYKFLDNESYGESEFLIYSHGKKYIITKKDNDYIIQIKKEV